MTALAKTDLTTSQKVHLAAKALAQQGQYGLVSELAQQYDMLFAYESELRMAPYNVYDPDYSEEGVNPSALIAGDISGDELADVAVAGPEGRRIYLGTGGSSFIVPEATLSLAAQPNSMVIGDLTGDGIPEPVVAASDGVTIFSNAR